jgi:hypothetical protein
MSFFSDNTPCDKFSASDPTRGKAGDAVTAPTRSTAAFRPQSPALTLAPALALYAECVNSPPLTVEIMQQAMQDPLLVSEHEKSN